MGDVLYCNLHCDDELRAHRLRTRRRWQPADDDFIERHRKFAAWLLEHASDFRPPMPVVDTSRRPPEAVADEIGRWVEGWIAEYAHDPRIRFR